MEGKTTSVVISGAAIIALLLAPLGPKTTSTPVQSKFIQSELNALAIDQSKGPHTALLNDDTGPWHALCHEFQDVLIRDDKPGHSADTQVNEESVEVVRKHPDYDEKIAVHEHPARRLASCVPPNLLGSFQLLIVTVPDPVKSHLDLDFDRYIESIQRAAGVADYDFERYWFPWRTNFAVSQTALVGSEETGGKRSVTWEEEQPGVLIFRHRAELDKKQPHNTTGKSGDKWLLIFLVGETPTSGINRLMFTNALSYLGQLGGSEMVKIVGPNFSASYASLADLIAAHGETSNFHILSPNSSSASLIRKFKQRLNHDLGADRYQYSALEMRTCGAIGDWAKTMRSLGYQSNELAFLGEDESAYGIDVERMDTTTTEPQASQVHITAYDYCSQSGDPSSAPISEIARNQFPRDLSSLRNAQEAQPQLASTSIAGVNLPQLGVPLTLQERGITDRDSPPAFAADQSPARIDHALQGLVYWLRRQRIQAIFLTATNPLDLIYLLDYLHQHLPDVRLATFGADEFMLGRPKFVDLSGTLVVTNLPLLPDYGPNGLPLDFPSTNAEGMFLAVSDQLNSQSLGEETTVPTCATVSVVGRTGFSLLAEGNSDETFPCNGPKGSQVASINPIKEPLPWIWTVVLIVLAILTTWHGLSVSSSFRWIHDLHGSPCSYKLVADSPASKLKVFYLFILTNQLFLLEWVFTTTTLVLFADARWYQLPLLLIHPLLLVALGVFSARLLFMMIGNLRQHSNWELDSRNGKVAIFMSSLFVVWTVVMWWYVLCNGNVWAPDRAVAVRSVQLAEGVSALAPITAILLAYALWAFNNLRRLTMIETRQVYLLFKKDQELQRRHDSLQRSIDVSIAPMPLILIVGIVVAGCIFRLSSVLRGIDGTAFQWWILIWGFGSLLITILIVFDHIWTVWRGLRTLLGSLNVASLREPLKSFPKELSTMQIWRVGGNRVSFRLQEKTLQLLEILQLNSVREQPQSAHGHEIEHRTSGVMAATGTEGAPQMPASPIDGRSSQGINQSLDTHSQENSAEQVRSSVSTDAAVSVFESTASGNGARDNHENVLEMRSATVSGSTQSPLSHSLADTRKQLQQIMQAYESGQLPRSGATRKLSDGLNVRLDEAASVVEQTLWNQSPTDLKDSEGLRLYFCYRIASLVRYSMLQLRNMLFFVVYGYAGLLLCVAFYPFQGRQSLGSILALTFIFLLCGIVALFIQMDRNPVLASFKPPASGIGEIFEVTRKMLSVGGLPLLAVIASQFPAIAQFLISWIKPVADAAR
jgi:hypothetical protein